jgi:predicted amidohydrolase
MTGENLHRRKNFEPACVSSGELINAGVMFTRHRVAAISFRPNKWDKAGNAERMEELFRKAARRRPDLILAPEGALEGYVTYDVIWHSERRKALLDIAEPVDGPYIRRFCELAEKLHICICFGFAERIKDEVYNSAIFIDSKGDIRGIYHKVSEGTHPDWYFSRQGKTICAFDTPMGRCGILICSDRWYPLIARTLVLDGAQFLLIPTYGFKKKAQNQAVLSRSRENGVPIVEANVGMNLIINRGEIAAYAWGYDRITTASIDIPVPPSKEAAVACEREFMRLQPKLQKAFYRTMMTAIRKNNPAGIQDSLVSESTFQKLRNSNWGEKLKC